MIVYWRCEIFFFFARSRVVKAMAAAEIGALVACLCVQNLFFATLLCLVVVAVGSSVINTICKNDSSCYGDYKQGILERNSSSLFKIRMAYTSGRIIVPYGPSPSNKILEAPA